ncbi:iron-containing alcohol dehydrogenase [Glaesserella parasuis]|nr:iron-containing alcohol dehydrogenase [Glaesserella parasuis]MDG6282455.1 iron-containing alcohol dehydrogenase [Glaesserella parasuis]MDG6283918.1 iron-containing alcohol dehydrogenase [Glaesserella parasuis]MDG6324877.1 iron-containing alcohol dehydrogenase [Glaesserella parasuis]MDG6326883.1 iron-containing alcohol dehydrogenase [Glaesserella parasuis]MDG6454664.1 iron-containing alcohol dehydrogenase [Glaesserella parasuis]
MCHQKKGVEKFKASGADYMIAIGGGSPIDSAKGIGIIINNPEFSDVLSLEGVAPTHQNACQSLPYQPPQVQQQK